MNLDSFICTNRSKFSDNNNNSSHSIVESNSMNHNVTLQHNSNDMIIHDSNLETEKYSPYFNLLNSNMSEVNEIGSDSFTTCCTTKIDKLVQSGPLNTSSNYLLDQVSNLTSFIHDPHYQNQYNISSPVWDGWSTFSSGNPIIYSNSNTTTTTDTIDRPYDELDNLYKFVEIFKQKRIKLGITQAEVGHALGDLNVCSFGCLSQSTICRFESLSLSHNNMFALKPVLEIWLKQMEENLSLNSQHSSSQESRNFLNDKSLNQTDSLTSSLFSSTSLLPTTSKHASSTQSTYNRRRKRTSITGSDKYLLELYFRTVNCRPTVEQMNQLASQLNMTKSVIRVWFCNQRQKLKRLSKLSSNSSL
ncbi:unnamed protein product [Heterobilharzia americana]|nr:unnamed protein product [Heterobilharzia americana]